MGNGRGARTGGQILVDQLKIHGADMAFGVPGESYLALLDARGWSLLPGGWTRAPGRAG